MSAYLTLNRFVESANQSFTLPTPKSLVVNPTGMRVELQDASWSTEALEQNKRTWKIFRESLIGTMGQRKFDWICHRYRSNLSFAWSEQTGQPLLPQHIELFSIGSHQITNKDIKDQFNGRISTLTREQLSERIRLVQPFPILERPRNPVDISGVPGSVLAHFIHDKVLMDKEKQLLLSDAHCLPFHAWLERFSKTIVNRELLEGQIIPAPGQDGRIDYYKVQQKISTGDGLIAYALKPATCNSTLKPLIVFRPSQWAFSNEDAFETYLNDVQNHVGEMGWTPAKPLFEQLMRDPHFRRSDEKIGIAGYSLGGAHAQLFLEDHYENVANAVFYCDPSVDDATAERIKVKINAMPRRAEPLNMQIFRMKRDFCDCVGGKHAGWGVEHPDVNIQLMVIDHENKQVSSFHLHAHRIFDNTSFPYQMQRYEDTQELFNRLDNSKRGPDVFWYEKMRLLWGRVAYYSLYSLSELIKLTSWIFAMKVLRSSRNPEL